MSTVACAGCGMPRAAELVASTGCPVCGHVVSTEPPVEVPREWASPPVEGPPAPVPEPVRVTAPAPSRRGLVVAGLAFAVGAAVGAGGLLAWQGRPTTPQPVETTAGTKTAPAALPPPPAPAVAVAPMPRVVPRAEEPAPLVAVAPPAVAPPVAAAPVPAVVPAAVPVVVKAAGKAVHIEVNEPGGTYTLTVPMRRGEHVVLKGKVGTLKLDSVEAGSTLDASALEADTITMSGRVDGGAVVKLNAPFGTVNVMGKVDGGSRLSVAGRVIYLNGGVGGDKTLVQVVIGRAGTLRSAGVSGTAVVEYAAASGGWSEPDVVLGDVAAGATVRKPDEK